MQRTKRLISALLAIVMLVSVFTTGASAATAVSGSYKTLAYYVVTDATGNEVTEVSAGQEVTVNVYLNAAAANDDLSSAQLQIWYDDEVYSYVENSLTWGTTIQGWYDESQSEIKAFNETNTNTLYNNSVKAATADGTLTTHPNWLSCLILYVVDAGSTTYYIKENADEAIASFKLKVADDVTADDDFAIGCPSSLVWTKAVSSRGAAYHYVKSAKTATIGAGEVEPVPTVALSYKASCDHSADKLTWTTVTASTCKTAGTEKGVCSCGEYETTRALPLDADNHEGPFTWTTVTDSTYTTTGLKKEVCACGKDTGKTEIIPLKEFVTGLKGQIRFHKDENGAYAGTFDVRALATIPAAKFEEVFTADKATQKSMIKEVGFVFASGASVTAPSMDAVKGLVENGTEAAGYTKKTVKYISTSLVKDNYTFSCIVTDIPDAQKTNSLVAVGYIAWDSNNDGKVDSYAYYPTAQTISFETLYNTHYNTAFPQA